MFYCRPSRPVSLNLEQQLAGDNSSEVTGQTSGYSTSNDSDLEDARELDFDDEDLLPSRETQVNSDASFNYQDFILGNLVLFITRPTGITLFLEKHITLVIEVTIMAESMYDAYFFFP